MLPIFALSLFFYPAWTESIEHINSKVTCGFAAGCSKSANCTVHYVWDHQGHRRCVSVVLPKINKPLAVLLVFHGSGSNAKNCGAAASGDKDGGWLKVAKANGFALACMESLHKINNRTDPNITHDHGWNVPLRVNNSTGNRCDLHFSADNSYVQRVVELLATDPARFDTSAIFTAGCSKGSAMAFWQGSCLHERLGAAVTAFATHSTGLKLRGDGLKFPHNFGQCKDGCHSWPALAKPTPNLKACIFDNRGDKAFYHSSVQLATRWYEVGNKGEAYFGPGGHCVYHYGWHQKTVECLDDGSGRLIKRSRKPLNASRHARNVSVARFGSDHDDLSFFEEQRRKKAKKQEIFPNTTTEQKRSHRKGKKGRKNAQKRSRENEGSDN